MTQTSIHAQAGLLPPTATRISRSQEPAAGRVQRERFAPRAVAWPSATISLIWKRRWRRACSTALRAAVEATPWRPAERVLRTGSRGLALPCATSAANCSARAARCTARSTPKARNCCHWPRDCQLHLPARIGDYTDFYVGIQHATNVGKLFRPDNPLLPNYKYVPIGYHGRASSIVRRAADVRRPKGQTTCRPRQTRADVRPMRALGLRAGAGHVDRPRQRAGRAPSPSTQAEHICPGFCLLNDWSARDIQAWEYQPLGPFLSKNFVTTRLALDRDRRSAGAVPPRQPARPDGDPQPLPYLFDKRDQAGWRFRHPAGSAAAHRSHARASLPARRLTLSNSDTCTGPWHKWSRTTASTAASCRPVTCSVRVPCPARKTASSAACWKSPRAVKGRWNWPPARCASSSKTATKSSWRARCTP